MRLACLAVVVSVGSAHANPQLRSKAEQFERDAKQTKDPATFVECGKAYFDLYNDDPASPTADEALYHAAVCFEEGRSAGAAIQALAMVLKSFPNSKLMPRALARQGKLYERIGFLDKAADVLETYATKFAGEKDAAAALSDATHLRRAIHDDDKAIANTQLFVRNFATKKPTEAAQAVFALGPIYQKKSAAAYEQHLRDYIRTYGGREPELLALAYVGLGESLWKRSCKTPDGEGLCVKITRDRTLPVPPAKMKAVAGQKRCGAATVTTIAPIARDAKLVAEAIKALDDAEKTFVRSQGSVTVAGIHGRARGRLVMADRDLEEYIALRFPTGLDFTPNSSKQQASLKRFNDYLAQKTKLGTLVQGKYTAVADFKDPATSISAIHRYSLSSHSMANDLLTAEIPVDVRSGQFAADMIPAFCDKLSEVAEPMVTRASDGYDLCLEKASNLGIDNATVKICAAERAALGPMTAALSTEIVPALPIALPVVDEAPVRATAGQPQPVQTALGKLWAVYVSATFPQPRCEALLRDFEALAKQHALADVHATVGYLHARCGKPALARAAQQRALQIDPRHAIAMSNLATLDYREGKRDAAAKAWTDALAIDGKLFGARIGMATVGLAALRGNGANRVQLEKDVQYHAASAAAIDVDRAAPAYSQLAILAATKSQWILARYFVEAARRLDTSGETELAYAMIQVKTGGYVLATLETAATAWSREDVHLALGIQQLVHRRYATAALTFLKVKTPSYELAIARAVAARGIGKYADAEKFYTEAITIDATRPEAHFNLGVLWKDYTAARTKDAVAAKAAFKKAAAAFRRVDTPDAKAWADDCDKAIAALP